MKSCVVYSSLGIQGTGRKARLWMRKLEGVACFLRRHLALSVSRAQSCSCRPEPSGVQARRAGKGPSSKGKRCLRHSSARSWNGSAARECVAGFFHSLFFSRSFDFSEIQSSQPVHNGRHGGRKRGLSVPGVLCRT